MLSSKRTKVFYHPSDSDDMKTSEENLISGDFDRVLSFLQELHQSYLKLRELEEEKTHAITERNGALLHEKVRNQERVMHVINQIQGQITPGSKMSEVIEEVCQSDEEQKTLGEERDNLLSAIDSLRETTGRNGQLLQDNLQFFQSIIAALKEEEDGYGHEQKRQNKPVLIDINV